MIPLGLEEITAAVGGTLAGDHPAPAEPISAVSTDSRQVTGGELFVALLGARADGHDFVAEAAGAGARAALVSRRVEAPLPQIVVDDTRDALGRLGAAVRRRVDPTVVAVTGSVGKTTTKDLTAAAVGAGRRTVAATASFNNELGVPLTLLALEPDTEVLVAELGARGVGHIAALTPMVAPDVGVVTRVAPVHLELFGDLDTVARAKSELVAALPSSGHAVLNADDARVAAMATRTAANVVRYGVDGDGRHAGIRPDVWAEDVELDELATPSLTACTPWGSSRAQLPVAGRHNVSNALAALAVAGALGVSLDAAAGALAAAPVSDWRSAVDDVGGVVILNDAYNANPTSVRAAVATLGEIAGGRDGRTWAVLGVMAEIGAEHDAEHAAVGRHVAEAGVDRLVVVGDDAGAMLDGAREAGMDGAAAADDAETALGMIAGQVAPGDVVLVKASRVAGLEAVAGGLSARLQPDDAGGADVPA